MYTVQLKSQCQMYYLSSVKNLIWKKSMLYSYIYSTLQYITVQYIAMLQNKPDFLCTSSNHINSITGHTMWTLFKIHPKVPELISFYQLT